MKPSAACYELIKRFEGLRLRPYLDLAGVPTIGYGSTFYEDGSKVTMKDKPITRERADSLFRLVVDRFSMNVSNRIVVVLNQNQFDSLVSFTYNVGVLAFSKSTLLRKVNVNPCDVSIRVEFMKWNKARDPKTKQLIVLPGLTTRRKLEADLYFRVTPL
jgi:lysozyme